MYDFLKKHVRVFQRVLVLIFAEAIVVQIGSDCQSSRKPIASTSTLGYVFSESFNSVLNVLWG